MKGNVLHGLVLENVILEDLGNLPYAAQVVTQDAGKVARSHGRKEVLVKVKGPGMGRDSAIRALQSLGFNVSSILDVTPVPHNGCRAPKRRRV